MHKSVLLNEVLNYLSLKEDSIIIDCTLGYAGHSSCILKEIKKGFLYAFDQDEEAIISSDNKLKSISSNYEIIKSNFVNLEKELKKRNVSEVDGILFDLGVSSPQLDETDRGFSFHKDAKLDMRMDRNNPLSAYEVVNNYSYQELVNILYKYGEEKYATSIVKGIIKYGFLLKSFTSTFILSVSFINVNIAEDNFFLVSKEISTFSLIFALVFLIVTLFKNSSVFLFSFCLSVVFSFLDSIILNESGIRMFLSCP